MSRSPAPKGALCVAALSLVVLLLSTAAADGQQIELLARFEAGAEHVYNTTVSSMVDGGGFTQSQTLTTVTRQRVMSVGEDGSSIVRVTTESIKLVMNGPMGFLQYDSQTGEMPAGPFASVANALASRIGQSQDMKYSREGALISMEGAAGLRTSEDLMGFPEGPVRPGAEWDRDSEVTLPTGTSVGSSMKAKSRYRLREVTSQNGRQIAVIDLSTSGTLEQDPSSPMASMMGTVPIESTGEIHFDVERGLMIRSVQRQVTTMNILGESMKATSETVMELVP